jgi:hypothetical protein
MKAIVGHYKWVVYYKKGIVKIGCKIKTIEEWDLFFASTEVFETARDSLAFNQIYKTYRMAKIAQELDHGII